MLDTLSRSGGLPQTVPGGSAGILAAGVAPRPPDAAQVAGAIAQYRACEGLREFRARLYGCLASRPDALFELADAILCADHAVTSLVQLSLVPEFRRGHGALYAALADGRVDEGKLAALLTGTLPRLVDGPEGRAWVAEHDMIDYSLLERALAGLPAETAAQVREACARWRRLRFAIDATPYPRPDAECSPGREHVHHDACRCDGDPQDDPGLGVPVHSDDRAPAHRLGRPDRRRAHHQGRPHPPDGPPGEKPAAPPARGRGRRRALGGFRRRVQRRRADRRPGRAPGPPACPAARPQRVCYEAITWPGKHGRPGKCGMRVACHKADDPDQSNPEPEESLVLPGTPRYGTVRVQAWRGVHPVIHGDRGWFADWDGALPVLRGTVLHVTVTHLPDGRTPPKAMWLWHAGPAPLSLDELWRACLARFDEEHYAAVPIMRRGGRVPWLRGVTVLELSA